MEPPAPAVNLTACQIHHLQYQLPVVPCDRCGQAARAVDTATRTALDIALDGPVLLHVSVSVHHCPPCRHSFRAQPPFLRPDATYTNRVVTKAVQSVYHDGMAVRRAATRLARDFWVQPSEGMIRRWCQTYAAGLDFAGDYQPWVVAAFSGILCVDEVYQDRLALLLAVDPAAPEGDRLVGYQLVHGPSVGHADVAAFLEHLRHAGVQPEQVITDGSPLYPGIVAAVWPQAAHQLCLFHQTRQVTRAVGQAISAVRDTLPSRPSGSSVRQPGTPAPAPAAPSSPARPAPAAVTAPAVPSRGRGRCRRAVRQAGIALVHTLREQGQSIKGIARQTGISRPTIRCWLQQPVPEGHPATADGAADPTRAFAQAREPGPPPAPWESWEQVQQVRQAVGADRFRLLRRPEHLTADDQAAFEALFASPVGEALRLARSFLEDWYAIWRDDRGQRRSPADAQERYMRWQTTAEYATLPPLRKVRAGCDGARFAQLSHFLRQPSWEATNNGAERAGRAFRHQQAPHFSWRTASGIAGALTAEAYRHKEVQTAAPHRLPSRCARGRKRRPSGPAVAA